MGKDQRPRPDRVPGRQRLGAQRQVGHLRVLENPRPAEGQRYRSVILYFKYSPEITRAQAVDARRVACANNGEMESVAAKHEVIRKFVLWTEMIAKPFQV